MNAIPSLVEQAYHRRIDAMSPAEKVARSAAMFEWVRDQFARQIVSQKGEMGEEMLKWHVALRLYGDEPLIRELIERKLADVSR